MEFRFVDLLRRIPPGGPIPPGLGLKSLIWVYPVKFGHANLFRRISLGLKLKIVG